MLAFLNLQDGTSLRVNLRSLMCFLHVKIPVSLTGYSCMTWRGVKGASELLSLPTTLPQVMKGFPFLMLSPSSFQNPMSFRLLCTSQC